MIVLITGPVRSGKSLRAIRVARDFGPPVTHVLTARLDPGDAEMAARVARHRAERGSDAAIELWQPGTPDLPQIIAAAPPSTTLLVDSLGTWIAGQLFELEALVEVEPAQALARLEALADPLAATLAAARAHVVVVAEETGWGLVPTTAQGRLFRDHLGRLTRRLGQVAERVELVVAGYCIDLRRWGVAVS
jgi:adenosylcobinamide kinase/adenosylcobinamide-phosphate guanylyltransferase